MNIIQKPVRNFTAYKGERPVDAVVIHIMQGSADAAYNWFNDPISQASSHLGLRKDGSYYQFVDFNNISWHAGGVANPSEAFLAYHNPLVNPNSYSVGIECEGYTGERFTAQMITALQEMLVHLANRYGWKEYVYGKNILQHGDINTVSRGACPGIGIHMTNDLILPVNKLLMPEDIKLYDALSSQREDIKKDAGVTPKTVYEGFINWWHTELLERMAYAWLNGTLNNYLKGIATRPNSFVPTEYTPKALRDLYVLVISKNGNIWNEKYNPPVSDTNYVTKKQFNDKFKDILFN